MWPGRYLGKNLEQFAIDFMRDLEPHIEVTVWRSIASAWSTYHDNFLGGALLADDLEQKLVAALIVISTGEPDMRNLCVSAPVGTRLLACYGCGN